MSDQERRTPLPGAGLPNVDAALAGSTGAGTSDAAAVARVPSFDSIYEEHFAFVWRTLRRYGVPDGALDDASQDVFMVVHGSLAGFEGRSSLRTWLFGIARRVARNHRPNGRSIPMEHDHLETVGGKAGGAAGRPAAQVEAAELLHILLDKLDAEKRDAFILIELEQFTIHEAADALGVNRNTMYSRLRAAREELEQAVVRLSLQDRRSSWTS